MSLSSISTTASSMLINVVSTISSISALVVKYLFTSTANAPESTYTNLTLANTNGFITDGSINALECLGISINNNIINELNIPLATSPDGITIMFKLKLTTTVTYTSNFNKYVILQSKAGMIEDGFFIFALLNTSGTSPQLWFQYLPTAVSGSGNNKILNYAVNIPSSYLTYDNTYHFFCLTINPTDATGNNLSLKFTRDSTLISSVVQGNTSTNHYNNLLQMKIIGFFPPAYTIAGQTTTWNLIPAKCRITDFRIYNRLLQSSEIEICRNGGEL